MRGLKQMLLEEQKYLEKIINKAKIGLSTAPEGHLRISKDKNKIRYYHCTENSSGVYIPKSDKYLPQKLAQKTYNLSVIKKAEARLNQIKKITRDYSDDEIEELFTSLHADRQALVIPVEPTWKQLLDKWYAEKYQGKEFQEGTAVILTEKGERVRSKSEKILADFFYRRNILYKYEKPLYLKGYGTVYPDFTFLSKKTGKEIYWEHEGMIDKQEYARSAVRKIESYQKNDIYLGDRLILTFETEQRVLNSKAIEGLVNKYL
ncbi:MAG: hypothetical protein ACI4F9_04360 [Lachnospiraceae bacterium]